MRRALAVAATVAVAALGALIGAAPTEGAPAYPPERPTRVLALGDSVMEGAAGALPAALPDREVVVDTEVSRSTAATADAAAGHGTDWDVVAILIAHNDGGSTAYQSSYNRMLDQFAAVPAVVLLTLHEVRPGYGGVNQYLRDQAATRPNVVVADWNATVGANPGSTAGDGLHLNGTGAGLLAGLVAGEVQAAEQRHLEAILAEAVRAQQATSTTAAPTTTTTVPPTTTTAPPTTTTEAVVLAPPVSVDRDPTTTTAAEATAVRTSSAGSDGGLPGWLVWALPAGLVLGAASLALTRRRRRTADPA